jgi:hypothetical protein
MAMGAQGGVAVTIVSIKHLGLQCYIARELYRLLETPRSD